jgi:hypothetical protein
MVFSLVLPAIGAAALWLAAIPGFEVDGVALAARDYTSMWATGHLVSHGQLALLFDREMFNAALHALFGPGLPVQVWSYPPPWLLIAVPISALPLFKGFLVWTGATLVALWLALRAGGLPAIACTAVLCSPAVADNALAGQNGALTATLLLGGFLLVDRRPVLAGAMFGALVFKPQLALLVPICLLASSNWRALSAGAITAGAAVIASALFFGSEAWWEFFTRTQPTLAGILHEPWAGTPFQRIFVSPLMAARSVGASLPVAYGVQIAITLSCGIAVWRIWSRPCADLVLRAALTVPLTLVAAPWVHSYDMVPLAAAVIVLFRHRKRSSPLLLGFAWFWPGAAVLLPIPMPLEVASIVSIGWLGMLRLHGSRKLPCSLLNSVGIAFNKLHETNLHERIVSVRARFQEWMHNCEHHRLDRKLESNMSATAVPTAPAISDETGSEDVGLTRDVGACHGGRIAVREPIA